MSSEAPLSNGRIQTLEQDLSRFISETSRVQVTSSHLSCVTIATLIYPDVTVTTLSGWNAKVNF
ncbi:hypothetical protein DPMN_061361 [Dreissena polymorpha]|uniref:Uncharacterized protein n=1 Tax=Dreissena polymorpha TaxID=45954 RepID=A0A9D4HGJ6_DREPO|nr:hypothetical protein DPMN_061067 [Dreissena polymorpha]KAH3718556.1 hypothetical protein DPMN_061361 [Dreissena polymorpha]